MKVLIVDDNPLNLELLTHVLGTIAVAQPVPFADPEAALAWCAGEVPDLVLLDYQMPQMDGLECLRRLRVLPGLQNVPVMMLTADSSQAVRHEALRLGANDFLTRPLNHTELHARIGNLLVWRLGQNQLAEHTERLGYAVQQAEARASARTTELVQRLLEATQRRDPDTAAHMTRIADYALLIARQLRLDDSLCQQIADAAPLHDVGKLALPDELLCKTDVLSQDELALMRTHAEKGAAILADSDVPLLQMAAQMAHSHHEHFDGSGYPQGLAGDAIPLVARIVAVADVFDSLTSAKPYRPGWEVAEAVQYLRDQRGSQFDPDCVDALLRDMVGVRIIHTHYEQQAHRATRRAA
ncbi:response regulator [Pseudoduganella sp. FT93W]|uniref:Response regulator n=1 Tax=Duganella fentianensis TaxID=2692177 RepID=A0A845HV15_9BURK|nr:HD domain-containing phosphohydrolase [Duganella fentianensis]MYN44869.1 response regulator [Duganella fentianensis]